MIGRSPIAVAAGVLSLVVAAASHAAQVDLTAYLAPLPAVGDYRIYVTRTESAEYERWLDVASVEEIPGGWRVVWQSGVTTTEEIVRPGIRSKRRRDGSAPVACQLAIDWELRHWDLSLRVGATRRFRAAFLGSGFVSLFYDWVRHAGRYRLAGFEAIETSYASHASAARLESIVKESRAPARIEKGFEVDHGPLHLAWEKTSESWFVEGVGLVGVRTEVREREAGGLGPPKRTETWLKAGRIQGLPYP